MFVAVTVIGMGCGFVIHVHRHLADQSDVYTELQRAAECEIRDVERVLGEKSFLALGDLVEVDAMGREFAGRDLSRFNLAYIRIERLSVRRETPSRVAAGAIHRLRDLQDLSLRETTVTDADLRGLEQLSMLERLDLESPEIDGTVLERLACEQSLDFLHVKSKLFSDRGVRAVIRFPLLRILVLDDVSVRSEGSLSSLGSLNNLQIVGLSGELRVDSLAGLEKLRVLSDLTLSPTTSPIEDTAFAGICRCRRLKRLSLSNLQLSRPETLRELARLDELEELTLKGEFPNQGLEAIAQLRKLWHLSIANPSLDNEGIRGIAACKAIEYLELEGGKFDDRVIDELGSLPLCSWSLAPVNFSTEGFERLKEMWNQRRHAFEAQE